MVFLLLSFGHSYSAKAGSHIGRKSQLLPQLAGPCGNISIMFGQTRIVCLPDGKKNLKICFLILTEYMNVMDRHRMMA